MPKPRLSIRPSRQWAARRRRALTLVLCATGLLMGAAPELRAEGGVKLALLPIVVHSAEDPQYLREGLADMLVARLDQVDVFDVSRIEGVDAGTTRLAEAVAAGRKAGADFVLFGSFTRFGMGASLDMQCTAVSSDDEREPLREIFVHSGSIGDVIPDLDDLVGKVARFAVSDYETRAVSAGPPGIAQPAPSAELQRRVGELEQAVKNLEARIAGPAASEAVEAP